MIIRKPLVAYVYLATISVIIVCLSSLDTTTAFVGRHNLDHNHRQYASFCMPKTTLRSKASKNESSKNKVDNNTAAVATATSTAEEKAAAITDFMAKAHEEKIAAMARVEDKYRGQITELEDKIAELEALAKQTTPTSGNSFAFPATNKEMTDKVQAYRTFISDYIVKSQEEKSNAVKTAEATMSAKYEAIIDGLKAKE